VAVVVVLTARKASRMRRDEERLKRGGGAQFVGQTPEGADEESVLRQVLSREPTPEFAAQFPKNTNSSCAAWAIRSWNR